MVKRIHHVLAILMTLSMLVVPLVGAAPSPEPAVGGGEIANSQPLVIDSQSANQPAPQMTLGQPTGEGPSLQANLVDSQSGLPAPQLSLADPGGQVTVSDVETLAEVSFELISVIRSCEDLTRFDLMWTGSEQIVLMDYVLFNSSDNVNTPGTVASEDLVGTTAAISARPGDTALSLDVQLMDGAIYSYVADASECGVSSFSVTQEPDATAEPTVDPTAEIVTQTPTVESTPKVVAQASTGQSGTIQVFINTVGNYHAGDWLTLRLYDSSGGNLQYTSYRGDRDQFAEFLQVPYGSGYQIVVEEQLWYAETESAVFDVSSEITTVTITLVPREAATVSFTATTTSGAPFPTNARVDMRDVSFENGYYTIWLEPQPGGSLAGSGVVPRGIWELSLANYDGYWNSSTLPASLDLSTGATHQPVPFQIDVAVAGRAIFEINDAAASTANGEVVITQGGVQIGRVSPYYSPTYGTQNNQSDLLPAGTYAWSYKSTDGLYLPVNGSFTIVNADVTAPITLQAAANGVIVAQINFPASLTDMNPSRTFILTDGAGRTTYRQSYGRGPAAFGPVPYGSYTLSVEAAGMSSSVPVTVNAASVPVALTLVKPDTISLIFKIDTGDTDITDGRLSVGGRIWNGPPISVGKYSLSPIGAGSYVLEIAPDSPEGVFWSFSSSGSVSITGRWLPGDSTTINITVPSARVFNVTVLDVDTNQPVPGLYITTPSNYSSVCGSGYPRLEPMGNAYQLRIFDSSATSCRLDLGIGAYTRVGTWEFSLAGPSVPIVLHVKRNTGWAANVTVRVDAPADIEPGYECQDKGGCEVRGQSVTLSDGSISFNGSSNGNGEYVFPSVKHGTYTVNLNGVAYPWLYDGLQLDNAEINADGQVVQMNVVGTASASVVPVKLVVKTADGKPIDSVAEVRIGSRWQYGVIGHLEPGASSVELQIKLPTTGYPIAVSVDGTGMYRDAGVAPTTITTGQVITLLLQPIVAVPATPAVVSLSPTSGRAGATTVVTGSTFVPGEVVTIRWGGATGVTIRRVNATASGTISTTVTIPATAAVGTFAIHASGTSGQTASATYKVTALAVVKVAVSPTYGRAGTVTTVSGSGFRPGETVTVRWGSTTGVTIRSMSATASGTISTTVTIPATAAVGTYYIHATGTSGQTGSAAYKVTALAIVKVALSPTYGRAGTVTTVTGSGFRPGEVVTVRWASTTGTIIRKVNATTSGTISTSVTVPAFAAVGTFNIHATGTSGQTGSAAYRVTALAIVKVTLSPTYGRAGTVTTVSGTGFRPGETVTVRFSTTTGAVLATVKATTTGTISAKITIPAYADKKAYAIIATGTSLQTGRATYTVTAWAIPTVKLSVVSGRAGTIPTVSGTGFRPGETVTVRFSTTTGTVLATVKATTTGTISAKVTIPTSAQVKAYAIIATGTSLQTGRATFTVTALASSTTTVAWFKPDTAQQRTDRM